MGSSFGGGGKTQVVAAEQVTPATARTANSNSVDTQTQKDARARLNGIRGTYNRFATNDNSGTSSTLG